MEPAQKGARGRADYEAEPKLGFAPPRSETCEGSQSGDRAIARGDLVASLLTVLFPLTSSAPRRSKSARLPRLTTKIVALVDALGNLVDFVLLPGQRHDSVGVAPLIEDRDFGALLGDKAFDNDWMRAELDRRGAATVIPPKRDRARRIPCDFEMYKWRHLIENFFCSLKDFRRVASRYEKTDESYAAMIYLAAAKLELR